jgi:hypothetical protein
MKKPSLDIHDALVVYYSMEYIYYRPRRGFTHRLVLLVRKLRVDIHTSRW